MKMWLVMLTFAVVGFAMTVVGLMALFGWMFNGADGALFGAKVGVAVLIGLFGLIAAQA